MSGMKGTRCHGAQRRGINYGLEMGVGGKQAHGENFLVKVESNLRPK